ncbi:MAG TPA: nucleotidyltransferase domain-containing protein [Gammaproteobacteria bacterium]|nr:nucleotidyltransferase domain-containing protein [Gammaproteobacteria bacterium]
MTANGMLARRFEAARDADPIWGECVEIVEALRSVLASQLHIRQAILFGSSASGRQTYESDIDLAVDAGRPLTAEEKLALISDLGGALGRPVDLIDLHAAGEPLLGQILRRGQRVLGSDSDYAGLIRRHVFDQADFAPYRARILAERRDAWIGR